PTQGDAMSQRTPVWRVLAALAALTLVASACGDGDDTTEGTTDTTAAEGTTTAPQNEGDGTLKIGTVLPETGSLASLGPPEFAGVELAVQEINEAGGVLGKPVEKIDGDSSDTSTDIANQTVDRLLSQNVDVIVGAASSAVTYTIIDKITGAGVVQFSPANTDAGLSDYDDDGLYFRTAPPDILQGRILAELITEDGHSTVGITALQDPYGEGLAEQLTSNLEASGAEVVATEIYDPQAQNFDAEVQALVSADPEAIAVIGFDESARVLSTMIEQGIGPQDKAVYLVDGNIGNALGEQLPEGSLEGVKGTLPGAEAAQEFQQRLLEVDPDLQDFSYAGEAYDAVVVSALAAEVAGSDAGRDIAENIPDVTREGEKCTSFAECKELVDAGEDIDYDGASGPIEMNDVGDPTFATIGIYTYGPDNKLTDEVDYRAGEL
ncbi:MAG TPA: ABC transporter substrate-binding protein, partial [Acidimicrobiales bacterium]|nr:ABC transporter substrate-binding protein [Acidimicrobiales bacterium]